MTMYIIKGIIQRKTPETIDDVCFLARYQLEPNTYGDTAVLHTITLTWSAKLTVVNIHLNDHTKEYELWENRYRHNEFLECTDFVIVYNCTNHFNAACMYSSLKTSIRAGKYAVVRLYMYIRPHRSERGDRRL